MQFSNLFAINVEEAYDLVKNDHKLSTNNRGPLCEKLAVKKVAEKFPSYRYRILTNLEYFSGNDVTGELDIVVWDFELREVVLIGEVKCKVNAKKARSEATRQMQRFQDYVEDGRRFASHAKDYCEVELRTPGEDSRFFDCQDFSRTRYVFYKPKDGDEGEDDIGLSLPEIDSLLALVKHRKHTRGLAAEAI